MLLKIHDARTAASIEDFGNGVVVTHQHLGPILGHHHNGATRNSPTKMVQPRHGNILKYIKGLYIYIHINAYTHICINIYIYIHVLKYIILYYMLLYYIILSYEIFSIYIYIKIHQISSLLVAQLHLPFLPWHQSWPSRWWEAGGSDVMLSTEASLDWRKLAHENIMI